MHIRQNWAGRFQLYHSKNPHVYQKLIQLAHELKDSGVRKVGMDLLFARLRWEEKIRAAREPGLPSWALNNSYRSFYARKLMEDFPDTFGGFFELREQPSVKEQP